MTDDERRALEAERRQVEERIAHVNPAGGPFMPCMHAGCGRESTYSSGRWVNGNHLAVDYWCAEHAPPEATSFEEDAAAWDTESVPTCSIAHIPNAETERAIREADADAGEAAQP